VLQCRGAVAFLLSKIRLTNKFMQAINHRMFVLAADGPDPWTADYELKPELNTYDQFAIDGTYFQHEDQLYHVYSCWSDKYSAWPANLCISKMSDPWTVNSTLLERQMISVPDQPWEQVPVSATKKPDTKLVQ